MLLAEDTLVNQKVATNLLQDHGHTVVVANNGEEALGALDAGTFDLVLMDVQMPVMDGFSATAAIREKEQATGHHIPIIAMTANAMKGDRERCLEVGMDDYIPKPIRAKQLYETVERIAQTSGPCHHGHDARADQDQPLDVAEALDRTGGDREMLKELAALFFEECPSLLKQIRHAIENRDPSELRQAAHALKSAVGVFAAVPASEAAWQLESMGRNKNLDDVEDAWSNLATEIERLKPVLSELK